MSVGKYHYKLHNVYPDKFQPDEKDSFNDKDRLLETGKVSSDVARLDYKFWDRVMGSMRKCVDRRTDQICEIFF